MKLVTSKRFLAASNALLELPMRKMPSPPSIALAIFFLLSIAPINLLAATSDPLEAVNRGTHEFNRVVDSLLIRPLASGYAKITPRVVRRGVGNFFRNLDDIRVGFNHLAQLKLDKAGQDFGRLIVNSSLGVGGLIDVADNMFGLEKNVQDFGMTLAHYGTQPGPYLVLPILGPSTVRDAFGLGVDTLFNPLRALDHNETRSAVLATQAIDYRAQFLYFDNLIIGDSYLFLKEAYLQQRRYKTTAAPPELAFEEF